jgi:inward rectifier potassium channel
LAKAKEQIELRRQGRAHVVRIGEREIEARGLSDSFWTDLYHRSMTVYWPVFFGTAAAIFIILNTLFAFLYWLGDEPIANVAGNEPLGLFYFSIETLATENHVPFVVASGGPRRPAQIGSGRLDAKGLLHNG